MTPKYSVIVPTFKRQDEVIELLESFANQNYEGFEIILVDGSPTDGLASVDSYVAEKFPELIFQRIYEKGLGISDSRNLGAARSAGSFLVFMDSDVIVPKWYFESLDNQISDKDLIAFGGPDAAHESFSNIQKAISFSMTSVFTTGGIRGKKSHVGQFKPRGFNMGVRKDVFEKLGGFNASLPVGEDMDLSARLIAEGHKTALIVEAFVYHKRRVSLKKFYQQVFRFGAARVMLSRMHHGELKITHLFPLFFVLYFLGGMVSLFCPIALVRLWPISIFIYFMLIFRGAVYESTSFRVGLLSIPVTVVQFSAYAMGFLKNAFAVWIIGKENGIFKKKEGEPESPI